MIKGKMYNKEFYFVDGSACSQDTYVASIINLIYKNTIIDLGPQDGIPELHLIESLKRAGAKDIEYTPNKDDNDVVFDYTESKKTMAKDSIIDRIKGFFHK